MKKTLLLFIYLLSCVNSVFAQDFKYFGTPFIKQYLPKEYDASAQNWYLAQDKKGVIYTGNSSGLLEFDGVNWRKYSVTNKSVVRSIAIGPTGKIWVGAVDEFGWFAPDSLGDLTYHSLVEHLPDSVQNFADLWETVVIPSGVYFFSGTKFFRWHEAKLTVINRRVAYIDKAFSEVYVWDSKKSLCLLKDTTLVPLLSEEDILKIGTGFKNICEYQDDKLLIVTERNGFFIYDIKFKTLTQPKLDPQIIAYFTQNRGAYTLVKINDDTYVVGTFKGGLLVFNAKLELTDVVNSMRGLQSNTIYALFVDQNKNLWTALQHGLARIDINNPLRSFGEKQNMNAFNVDAITFEGKKYVATMNGSFVLDKHELSIENDNHKFTYIPNLDNCWDLRIYKNKLLAVGNFGLSQIVDGKAKRIFTKGKYNAFSTQTSKRYPNHLFIGYRNDFVAIELVEQANSEFLVVKEVTRFPNIVGETRTIVEDKNGDLWLGMNGGGTVFIQFANDVDVSDYQMYFLDKKNDLPNDESISLAVINNQVNFLTTKGIYKQTDETQEVSSSTQFEYHEFWKSYSKYDSTDYNQLHKIAKNSYIMNGDYITAFLRKGNDSLVFNQAPFTKINGVSNLIPEQNDINVCTSSSFYMYNLNKDSVRTDRVYPTLIRKVSIAQDSLIFNGNYYKNKGRELVFTTVQGENQTPILDYHNNSIKICFSAIFYDVPKEIEYTYLLEGFNDKWTHWSKETNAVFTNVPEGKYTFKVKAKNIYETESTVATYQFTILAPWYRTFYAYTGYLLLLVGFIWFIVRLNSQRLTKEKIKLENTVNERTAEILVQAENLLAANDKLEETYTNVQLLSEIGQKITTKLSVEDIIDTVYEHVNQLMNAEVFAIGVISSNGKRLDFYGTKERQETLSYHFDELKSENKLSVYCYQNFTTIVLKDVDSEITKYLPIKPTVTVGESTKSLIYLPLGTVEKKVGVITVQSFVKNSYTDYHLNILRNIAIYANIALENASAYQQISEQHDEIKIQHHQIKSSLNYASTIQNAILPPQENMDELFDNFVIYRPKDIVSGDFYWMNELDNTIFIAVADCTGHGVPGAFMSMIGSRLLNNIVSQRTIMETDAILEALHIGVRKALRQNQTDNTDGMDICLCKVEKNEEGAEVSFTGAKRPLYVYQQDKSKLLRIRGDKKAIGGNYFQELSFTQTKLNVKNGDTIYLTTDGFVDQNNKERRKYSTKKLVTLLENIQDKSLAVQKEVLENELDTWQGNEKQRDDITILGIRI